MSSQQNNSKNNTSSSSSFNTKIIHEQMTSLDATDPLSTIWNDNVLAKITNETSLKQQQLLWGGRGKGGRGIGGSTIQKKDIILPNVTLEFVSDVSSGCVGSKVLLNDAKLKLLSSHKNDGDSKNSVSGGYNHEGGGRVYALVGRNGCGKSTLLRRMDAKKIPGFMNLHLKSLYIPQEVFDYHYNGSAERKGNECVNEDTNYNLNNGSTTNRGEEQGDKTPLDVVMQHRKMNTFESKEVAQKRIEELELELELLMENNGEGDDNDNGNYEEEMERICAEMSLLEDGMDDHCDNNCNDDGVNDDQYNRASHVLTYFGIDQDEQQRPMRLLSGGQKKKVFLACALFCDIDILLLDEPTNHLDMRGIIQLRGLIQTMVERKTIVVLVSHDVDLINHVATDVIHFANQTLTYYRGNYNDFLLQKNQHDLHKFRQQNTLDKQRNSMMKTIDNLQKQSSSSSTKGSKKISRAVNSRKKKLERHGIETDVHGHRRTNQKSHTGIKVGSINSLDASTRKNAKNYSELFKKAELSVAPVPDKEVQFKFNSVTSQWNEPLISALDVGHGFLVSEDDDKVTKMLFDSVDICIDEKSITCVLGENRCGKTTLLKILAGQMSPVEGKVHFAQNVNISYFDQHRADNLIVDGVTKFGSTTSSISLLSSMFPKKTEQEIRGQLSSFGLGPQQASTYIQFLSGGERCRLCLAMLTLSDPQLLVLDEISNHFDPESVDALAYGIRNWNGTVLMVSHDAHFIRQLDARCYILMKEGKLKYVQGGIDSYLNILSLQESKMLED